MNTSELKGSIYLDYRTAMFIHQQLQGVSASNLLRWGHELATRFLINSLNCLSNSFEIKIQAS